MDNAVHVFDGEYDMSTKQTTASPDNPVTEDEHMGTLYLQLGATEGSNAFYTWNG